MNSRIVHISIDEKFINSAYWQFEKVFKNKNLFFVLVDDLLAPLQYVKKKDNLFLVNSCKQFLEQLQDSDVLVVHSLHPKFYDIILGLSRSIKIIWMCFGYEIYNDNTYIKQKEILDKLTLQEFYNKKRNYSKDLKESIYPIYRLFTGKSHYSVKEIKAKVINRIDYLGTTFPEEYENISKLIKQRKALFNFSYYPLENIVDNESDILEMKPNILVGNSGYMTGNHIDVFNKLEALNIKNKKIFVPVSYGSKSYIEEINTIGKTKFDDFYFPMEDYLEFKEYNKILKGCGIAILNNFRQQALGNTLALLWFGSKVFLNEKNPLYHFLKRIGIIVFSYNTELSETAINVMLTKKESSDNRKILKKYFAANVLLDKLKNQLLTINE